MGCTQSKTTETVNGNINPVLHLDSANLANNNLANRGLTIADKIKLTRKEKNARNKYNKANTKYDPKITAKYEIKALLGKGKFTKVLRVENKLSKQPFALKVLEKAEGLETLECEISILRRVKHRQIIKLVEVFVSEQKQRSVTTAVVLELTTGGDLFDRLFDTGTYSERDAVKVLSQVLAGVQYLHSIGICHRDLKPNNILYYQPGKDSRLVITDFGMAHTRRSAEDTLMHAVCGTPEYLAPEVVARQAYTQAVDLWAVGVISYVLLRGEFPFSLEGDRLALFRQIAKAEYSLEDEVWQGKSSECRQFVSSLLCREGAQRPTATQALQHPWLLARHPSQPRARANKGERSGSSSSSCSSLRSLQQLRSASTALHVPHHRHHHHHHHHHSSSSSSSDSSSNSRGGGGGGKSKGFGAYYTSHHHHHKQQQQHHSNFNASIFSNNSIGVGAAAAVSSNRSSSNQYGASRGGSISRREHQPWRQRMY